ncbi:MULTISPECIES: exodeoxyribonuclease V subunit alpha [Marinomonas]|uniref:RecBCD enzyme subunit RecD n=1 Tax=Marinomonas arctica TaxID=383750 RepID=A0A7H1J9R2_9GAMM|nr:MULTISPECIES: exodeoxyribonuclease V subunit alpha [Marinomonas]MCS7485352.1 exodeoxyribonuclease V subunit alpha [Marinomonas sp. BSi20414]QNT07228.1 exodeoxyribonuclease V subunit alpha [Marinomonas arctica]GGN24730.1 RecBCD enzyme subunit RecD [Marinomonas arctica]
MDFSNQLGLLDSLDEKAREENPSATTPFSLSAWQSKGVLRAIDRQWIEQLAQHAKEGNSEVNKSAVYIAGALCSAYLGAGHICIDLANIWQRPPEGIDLEELRAALEKSGVKSVSAWCQVLQTSCLVSSADSVVERPMVLAGTRLYLYRYFQYEQQVLTYLKGQFTVAPFAVDAALLATLFPNKADAVDWQKVAVANAASLPFSVISGGPGTGKTTTVTRLLALLVAQSLVEGKVLRIELAAPTGKAAARLTESISKAKAGLPLSDDVKLAIPEQASTLHRLLGSDFGRSRFKHNKANPLHLDVLLVDEVSMVDLPMMAKLIDAMPPQARLILLGDKDQLASVEAGSVLGDLSYGIEEVYFQPEWAERLSRLTGENLAPFGNASAPPISRALTLLRTSYRFDANSGIGYLAKAMNAGDSQAVLRCLQSNNTDVEWRTPEEGQTKADIATLAKGYDDYWEAVRQNLDIAKLYEVFSRYQILTAVRQGEFGVEKVNAQLEQYFYQRGRVKDPHVWYPGKAVMLTRNDAALGLFNGDIGLCMPDEFQRLRVWFMQPDGSFTGLLPSRLSEFEVVFAMTVHKSQGSEFDHVALLLPMTPSPVLTKELLYTGITRAKRSFALWGSSGLIRSATSARIERYSGLIDELWH